MAVLKAMSLQSLKADRINIACSYGYDRDITKFVDDNFPIGRIVYGSFTCEQKFYAFDETEDDSDFLTIDDDIVYPLDYIKKLVDGIEKYQRKSVVSFHGSIFRRFPVLDFRKDRVLHQYFQHVRVDLPVHIVGSGVTGFYTGTLRDAGFSFDSLAGSSNMTDDIFSLFCRRHNIEMRVLQHGVQWMKIMQGTQDDQSTWKKDMMAGFDRHLKLINEV